MGAFINLVPVAHHVLTPPQKKKKASQNLFKFAASVYHHFVKGSKAGS